MRFGHFDDANKEYVITTAATPYPWINYLGSEEFFSLVSQQGGGYCFYRDARLRRITRYRYHNVPADAGGRYFYIRERDGDYWTPTFGPVKRELDAYECRHGLGYTKITGKRRGLEAEVLYLVPLGKNVEIHQLTLKNEGSSARTVKVFSFTEFCLWNAMDDRTDVHRDWGTDEVEVDGSTIYHKTEYRERRDHYAFYHVNGPVTGFDTDRESFCGLYNGMHEPEVVATGQSGNTVGRGSSPIASHGLEVTLAPGESQSFVFLLGYVENSVEEKWERPGVINKKLARELITQFSTPAQVAEAMKQLAGYWDNLLGKYVVQSADENLNRMVNIWNPYQCMITFNMSRGAVHLVAGTERSVGFCDSNQGPVDFVHRVFDRSREQAGNAATIQFREDIAYDQHQPSNCVPLSAHDLFASDPNSMARLTEHLTRQPNRSTECDRPLEAPLVSGTGWNGDVRLWSTPDTLPDLDLMADHDPEFECSAGLLVWPGEELEGLEGVDCGDQKTGVASHRDIVVGDASVKVCGQELEPELARACPANLTHIPAKSPLHRTCRPNNADTKIWRACAAFPEVTASHDNTQATSGACAAQFRVTRALSNRHVSISARLAPWHGMYARVRQSTKSRSSQAGARLTRVRTIVTTTTRVVALLAMAVLLGYAIWLVHVAPMDVERIAKAFAAMGALAKLLDAK